MMSKRKKWIDGLRALAMFFVVLGHLYTGNSIYLTLTGPIKMPLFYFLAGYVLDTNRDWNRVLNGLFHRIFVPYLIFSLFPLKALRYVIAGNLSGLLEYSFALFSGKILWFIPSFMLTQILVYAMHRALKDNTTAIVGMSIVLFVVGVVTADIEWMDFWCINTALTTVFYMNFGIIMREHVEKLKFNKKKVCLIAFLAYLFEMSLTILVYPGQSMDVHSIIYYNELLCLLMVITGITMCMLIAQNMRWERYTMPWICFGQETLLVYLMHGTLLSLLSKTLGRVISFDGNNFMVSFLYTVLICMTGTIISKVVGCLVPELVGKRRELSKRYLFCIRRK